MTQQNTQSSSLPARLSNQISGCHPLALLILQLIYMYYSFASCTTHLEPRHNAGAGGHGKQLNLHSTNPADGWQPMVHEQVVGLILKAPLADDQAST
jgi:hypothetical protein